MSGRADWKRLFDGLFSLALGLAGFSRMRTTLWHIAESRVS